ncbi:Condensin complex subunit [Sesamum angolense]|uniref:Condensin complex subunit n=1 Tax=Sesamum angolense TaxID=2727404 RepID=A0AAE1X4S0_9LAMI|nr:Condensin complex subunit [Sesamum angolense]
MLMEAWLFPLLGRLEGQIPKTMLKTLLGLKILGGFLWSWLIGCQNCFQKHLVLVPHFGGESYKIRNALVGVLGKLIAKAFNDVEGEVSSKSTRLRTKQAMLEILLERCRDVSAYTRSRVLQVWAELCEEHSLSIGLWNEVAAVASGRLEDKSAIVRKSALNLLIMMLQHNPFGPQLRAASFEATLEQYKKKLNELTPNCPSPNPDGLQSDIDVSCGDSGVENEESEGDSKDQDSMADSCLPHVADGMPQVDNSVPDFGNVEQTRTLVASLEAGLRFSRCISDTMPTLVQLMASSSSSDVENTILLLMRCRQFQINGSEACLRKMLPLVMRYHDHHHGIFSRQINLEAVENAFITIYIRKNPVETAKNLLNLAIDSNIGDLAALEFILGALVSKGDITASMLSALWDFFCFNISGTTAEQSRGALSVLSMAAKSSPTVLSSHLQDIVDIGFGRWAKVEPLLARTACLALQRLSEEDMKKLLSTNGNRVFGILEGLVSGFSLPENIWYAAADRAIAALYTIHPTPETIAADLVKKSLKSVFDSSEGSEVLPDMDSDRYHFFTSVQVAKLSRYLFIVSHVAMNQLVYIESCVRKIQKAKAKKEKMVAEDRKLDDNTASDAQKDDSINSELGLAASEDAMLDSLAERAEKEMFLYPELQASGMLALCRLMIIDAEFCESNLQLLFTVVENAVRNSPFKLYHSSWRSGSSFSQPIRAMDGKHETTLYIIYSDILGKLSCQNLTGESFCNIMQFLIGSIKKDKQMEALVEKLCNRFTGVSDIRQWEYISYCLSQLAFTEKSMRKLMESFKAYEHVLSEDTVMENFRNIINKGKKFAKPELKSTIEEFEEKIIKFHNEKKELVLTEKNAQAHQQKVHNLGTFMVTKKEAEESGESEITEDEEEADKSVDNTGILHSKAKTIKSSTHSDASGEVTELELDEDEVQSLLFIEEVLLNPG